VAAAGQRVGQLAQMNCVRLALEWMTTSPPRRRRSSMVVISERLIVLAKWAITEI
jgi:hypothetical protein